MLGLTADTGLLPWAVTLFSNYISKKETHSLSVGATGGMLFFCVPVSEDLLPWAVTLFSNYISKRKPTHSL